MVNNIVIFGASENGLRLKRSLETEGIQVRFFCDNNEKKEGNKLDGIDILSFEQVLQKTDDLTGDWGIVIAAREPDAIMEQIRTRQTALTCYGLSYEYLHNKNCKFQSTADYMFVTDVKKPRLEYYEYHISYHCNLKCKGCGHYSNLVPPEFGDFEQYERDIHRLKELYSGVKTIRLMGGEPLLNPKLAEFCTITRKAFPDANIRVVTNGLLIPGIDKEVLQVMRKHYIGFDITQYPPTVRLKEKIELKCIENDVAFHMSEPIEKFFSIVNVRGDSDREKEFETCISQKCHFLENGFISVCAMPVLNKKYRDLIDQRIVLSKGDIIDLYDKSLDGFQLNDLLSRPIELCRYCDNTHKKWFEWCGNYTEII